MRPIGFTERREGSVSCGVYEDDAHKNMIHRPFTISRDAWVIERFLMQ